MRENVQTGRKIAVEDGEELNSRLFLTELLGRRPDLLRSLTGKDLTLRTTGTATRERLTGTVLGTGDTLPRSAFNLQKSIKSGHQGCQVEAKGLMKRETEANLSARKTCHQAAVESRRAKGRQRLEGKEMEGNGEGDEEDIFSVDEIFDSLNTLHCSGLRDKPKIIIIQACRGDKSGSVDVEDSVRIQGTKQEHREKDFCCFRSSTP
ncbi:hypothetical protein DNTS_009050, partial [Danionella cerebrum]